MKIFVATNETQGKRKNDFSYTTEGELVKFTAVECDGEKADGACGCKRAMVGVESHKSTTTFKVAEVEMTKNQYLEAIRTAYIAEGWGKTLSKDEVAKFTFQEAKDLLSNAAFFPAGSIIEKRGATLRVRSLKSEVVS